MDRCRREHTHAHTNARACTRMHARTVRIHTLALPAVAPGSRVLITLPTHCHCSGACHFLPDQGQAGRMWSHPPAGSPERARSPCAAGGGGQGAGVPGRATSCGVTQPEPPQTLSQVLGAVEARAVGSALAWWRKSPSVRWGRRTHLPSLRARVGSVCLDVPSDSRSSAEQGLLPGSQGQGTLPRWPRVSR